MQIKTGFKIFLFAFIILILLGLFVARGTPIASGDFRNNLWAPTYLLTHNQSPYGIDKLFDFSNAVWMPMAVGLFFPLGFLSLQQATNLWLVCNLIWFLLIMWISSGSRRPSRFLFAVAVCLSLLFPPLVTHLWTGQISILITLLFMIIAIWGDKMPVMLLAALMAVSLSKPQLAILVLPGFMICRIREYGIQKAVQLVVYLICCIFLLTIPLFLADTNWLTDFILEQQQNPFSWAHPSSLNFLRNTLPNVGSVIWLILAMAVFAVNIWLWITLPNRDAIYWSLALTPMITPYIWTWDFVMILPVFISSLFKAKTNLSLGILVGGYLVCWSLITSMKIRGEVNDALFWWVPWLLMVFILGNECIKMNNAASN